MICLWFNRRESARSYKTYTLAKDLWEWHPLSLTKNCMEIFIQKIICHTKNLFSVCQTENNLFTHQYKHDYSTSLQ